MIHDKRIEEAQSAADNIIAEAHETADRILADARDRAQTALAAVNRKTEKQIESAQEKSEKLYLAARTRCANLLGDFKKELSNQKERTASLKSIADNYSRELTEMYNKQFAAMRDASVYIPAIDFERLTETRLFNMIMEEIKEDMTEIEDKNGAADYEFEKELALLQDVYFTDEYIKEYKSKTAESGYNYSNAAAADESGGMEYENEDENTAGDSSSSAESRPAVHAVNSAGAQYAGEEGASENEAGDDDVKVFAGSTAAAGTSEAEVYNPSDSGVIIEEEPMATYDSDDYQDNSPYSGTGGYDENLSGDSGAESESEEETEEGSKGIFGFLKGFGKRKRAGKARREEYIEDEPDDIDSDDDSKENEVMNIFAGLDEDEE
jgi:vacuolar-type H+-ATPase subunit H